MSFTEDVADALGENSGEALARLKAVAVDPLLPLANAAEAKRLSALCAELNEEASLAREGYRIAMRALLGADRHRGGAACGEPRAQRRGDADVPADARVEELRRLIDAHFRKERLISFYAEQTWR